MLFRRSGFIIAVVAVAVGAAARSPRQQAPNVGVYGQQSSGASVGPLTASVIGSWQWHGANDFVTPVATPSLPLPAGRTRDFTAPSAGGRAMSPPPGVVVDVPMDDWIVDFVVLWRWRGQDVSFEQGSVGSAPVGLGSLHRIVANGRELGVRFDPQSRTAQIAGGPLVTLNDHNVLMLDVEEGGVRVFDTLRIELRLSAGPPRADPASVLLAESRAVAAFVEER
jgi:hypothetical protein